MTPLHAIGNFFRDWLSQIPLGMVRGCSSCCRSRF